MSDLLKEKENKIEEFKTKCIKNMNYKNPLRAAILSLVPGMGHVYIGEEQGIKGILLFIISIPILFIGFLISMNLIYAFLLYVMFDAYMTAYENNKK